MSPQSRSPVLGLVLGGVALAAGTLLLFLLTKTPAESPDAAGSREAALPAAAAATAQERGIAGEALKQRVAQSLPAEPTVADGEYDARYRKALAGLKGRVLLNDDKPLPELQVEAFRASASAFLPSLETLTNPTAEPPAVSAGKVRTDADGRFLLTPVEPRSVYVLVLGAGTGRACFRIAERSPAPGEIVDLGDIVLQPGATLTGAVVDETGAPVSDAKVWVADFPALAFTFGLSWLAADGGLYFDEPFDGGQVMVMKFPPWVTELEKSVPLGEAITGPDGTFRLEGVKAGRPSLWIRKKGLVPLVHGPVAAEAGKERGLGKLKMKHGEKASGSVVDASGARVQGAEVMVGPVPMAGIPFSLLRRLEPTDGQGRFFADCLGREKILVVARRHEGDPWTCSKPLAADDLLQVQLEEGGALRVFATSTRDGLLRDAKFRITQDNPVMAARGLFPPVSLEKRALPQEDGGSKILGLKKGKWRVQVFAAGHTPAGEVVQIGGNEEQLVNVQMTPQVEGRIKVVDDATSEPVAFARVLVQGQAFGNGKFFPEGFPMDLGSTDRVGELGVTALAAGTHDVHVRHPQFGQKSASLTLPGPTLVVRMEPGGSIAGTVTKGGAPLTETWLVALDPSNTGNAPETEPPLLTCTALDGSFRYESVAPGKYRAQVLKRISALASFGDLVRFDEADEANGSAEVEVLAGKESRVTLSVAAALESGPAARIVGQVLINGAPVQDLVVSAWSGRRYRAVTDAAGRFEFARVALAEQVYLSISDKEGGEVGQHRMLASRVVKVKEGETAEVRVVIETGNLRGRVTLAADGSAVAGAAVNVNMMATPGVHEDSEASNSSYSATTDETGRFQVKNVVAGTYSIGVRHESFAKKAIPLVIVRRGEETEEVQIQLAPAVKVSGFIEFEKTKEKPEWLWVGFLAKGANDAEGTGSQVDPETGGFECGSLLPGKYQVSFYSPDGEHVPVDFEVTGNMKNVRIRVEKQKPKPAAEEVKEKKDG